MRRPSQKPSEHHGCEEGQSFVDVVQDVVAHLVSEDEQGFGNGHVARSVVPDHHTLGGAEASDVRIVGRDFLAGLHFEHAVARNAQSAPMRHFLNLVDEQRLGFLQGFELVEHGVEDDRGDKDKQNQERQSQQPEVKPPALRAFADDSE